MNLNGLTRAYQRNGEKGITVSEVYSNMSADTKIYYILESDIAIGCKLKNTPIEIMKYHVLYIETHYGILYVHIEKRKEKS